MTVRIDKKIIGYQVRDKNKSEDGQAEKPGGQESRNHPHARKARAARRHGVSSKARPTRSAPPLDDHALYVTINDIVLNSGTEHEQRRPFEIFINSKNMDHFQWIVALTRVMSAVFRKGGDVTFMAEELQAVFDPKGGYFKPGGRFVPSDRR